MRVSRKVYSIEEAGSPHSRLTNALGVEHVDKFLLVWEGCLLPPQAKPGHVAQIICFCGARGTHIKDPGIGQPPLKLHHCLNVHNAQQPQVTPSLMQCTVCMVHAGVQSVQTCCTTGLLTQIGFCTAASKQPGRVGTQRTRRYLRVFFMLHSLHACILTSHADHMLEHGRGFRSWLQHTRLIIIQEPIPSLLLVTKTSRLICRPECAVKPYPGGFAFSLPSAGIALLCNAVLGLVALVKHNGAIKSLAPKPLNNLAQPGPVTYSQARLSQQH